MRSLTTSHNVLLSLALTGLLTLAAGIAQAVTLNFSAVLMPGTCTFSLDKGSLGLGTVSLSQLQPATIAAAQPFTLLVRDCRDTASGVTPVVTVSGEGLIQDGRWLFRASDSAASGVGVMLTKTDVPPAYGEQEVKSGDDIPLAAQGVNPVAQNLTFYAGMTCGSSGCASLQFGTLTARVTFTLAYR